MAMQKKKEDRREVVVALPGEYFSTHDLEYIPLEKAIEVLQRIRDGNPGKKLELRYEYQPYSDDKYFNVYEKRPETDQEMKARQKAEAKVKGQIEAKELEEFKRLQKKFGA